MNEAWTYVTVRKAIVAGAATRAVTYVTVSRTHLRSGIQNPQQYSKNRQKYYFIPNSSVILSPINHFPPPGRLAGYNSTEEHVWWNCQPDVAELLAVYDDTFNKKDIVKKCRGQDDSFCCWKVSSGMIGSRSWPQRSSKDSSLIYVKTC